MAEVTSSEQPPAAGAADGGGSGKQKSNDVSKRNRGRRNRAQTSKPWKESNSSAVQIPKERFAGRSDDLKGFIYDVVNAKGGVAYTRTTEEIARYVGEKYTTTGSYIRTGILTLVVPVPLRPTAPTATGDPPTVDPVDIEIFKEKIRIYVKIESSIETSLKSLYDLIWGQCSETLR